MVAVGLRRKSRISILEDLPLKTTKRNNTLRLSDVDQRILDAMTEDASMSYAQLGDKGCLSSTAVHERVLKLKDAGVIKRIVALIDPIILADTLLCFVLLKINNTDKASKFENMKHIS